MAPDEIRQIRSELDLTQKELAQILDVSRPTVQRWEAGRTSPNQLQAEIMRNLRRKARETGRSLDWIESILLLASAGAFGALLGKIFSDLNNKAESDET